jgi:hypothetical protein
MTASELKSRVVFDYRSRKEHSKSFGQTPSQIVSSIEKTQLEHFTCKSAANQLERLSSILLSGEKTKRTSQEFTPNDKLLQHWSSRQPSKEEVADLFYTRCMLRKSIKRLVMHTQELVSLKDRATNRLMTISLREMRLYALNKVREREVGREISHRHLILIKSSRFGKWR